MNRIAENIAALIDFRGTSAKQVSLDAGLGATAVRDIVAGKSANPRLHTLERIAKALGVHLDEITLGERSREDSDGNPISGSESRIRVLARDQESTPLGSPNTPTKGIPEIDLRAGAGPGEVAYYHNTEAGNGYVVAQEARKDEPWGIPQTFIQGELHVSASKVHVIEVKGDSMQPTLTTGDRVLVDTADRRPSPPGLFVVIDEWGGAMVKRIQPVAGAEEPTLRVISDNEQHEAEEWPWRDHTIVGRVVLRISKI